MRLELKLRKVGNSLGGTLRVSAHDPEFGRQMDAAKSVMRRYRNTLRELAK